jgi:NADH-quinone oxidoreductase subunit E
MYYTENPGRFNLQVCRNVSCHLMGAQEIVKHLSDSLGISPGQTDEDGLFRLEEAECLGACGMAPMMQVGKVYFENLTVESCDKLIERFKAEANDAERVEHG